MKFLQFLELNYGIEYLSAEIIFSKIKDDQISEIGYMCALKYSM